jgi:hypothetical protein
VTPRDLAPRTWRTRIAIGLSALALAAVPITLSSGHASASVPCNGEGGQGAVGFATSLAQSCEQFAGSLLTTPTPAP